MKRIMKFTLLTTWIIFSRVVDLYATARFTPDLKQEGNPLVTLGGLSWTPLVIIVTCLVAYSIYALYISIFKEYKILPTEKGLNFGKFFAYIHLGQNDHWTSVMYKLPNDPMRWTHLIGYLLPSAFAFAGIVTTLMWIFINYIPGFYTSYYKLNVVYLIILIGTIIIWTRYYSRLYIKYKLSK
jgi:hypothetical protein